MARVRKYLKTPDIYQPHVLKALGEAATHLKMNADLFEQSSELVTAFGRACTGENNIVIMAAAAVLFEKVLNESWAENAAPADETPAPVHMQVQVHIKEGVKR